MHPQLPMIWISLKNAPLWRRKTALRAACHRHNRHAYRSVCFPNEKKATTIHTCIHSIPCVPKQQKASPRKEKRTLLFSFLPSSHPPLERWLQNQQANDVRQSFFHKNDDWGDWYLKHRQVEHIESEERAKDRKTERDSNKKTGKTDKRERQTKNERRKERKRRCM